MNRQRDHIYRAYNAEGVLLYIGRTVYPDRRIAEHVKSSPWGLEVARWDVTECETWWDALNGERRAIETERPLYNVMFNTNKGTAA